MDAHNLLYVYSIGQNEVVTNNFLKLDALCDMYTLVTWVQLHFLWVMKHVARTHQYLATVQHVDRVRKHVSTVQTHVAWEIICWIS